MNRYMVRGIIVLIALVGIAGVFLLIGQKTDTGPHKVFNAPSDEVMQKVRDDLAAQDAAKPQAPGEKAGTGHRHADGTWHEGEHESVAQLAPVPKTYDDPLTFHEELLKTNPVKALRLQSEERGHWSAEHIPPFPPDDTEAQEYARSIYLINYYVSIGDESNPILGRAIRAHQSQNRAIDDQFPVADPVTAREMDLWRLTWTLTDAGKITPYGGMTRYGRARMFPSDYFPDFIDVPK